MNARNFWALYGDQFPSLKLLAKQIFSLVSSTASSERSWSIQGFQGSEFLGNEKVMKLVFIKSNYLKLDDPTFRTNQIINEENLDSSVVENNSFVNLVGSHDEDDDDEDDDSASNKSEN
jgi:hypothetical protein